MRLAAAALALAAAAGTAYGSSTSRPFSVAPPPAWVEPLGWDGNRPAARDAADGIDHVLVDDQVRISPDGGVVRYRHSVWRILSTTGVENGSEVRVSFDPAWQRLTFHSVVLHRGREAIDALDPGAVKVIQQEEELERRLYDGRLTAVLFLRGVRTGDAVEMAYSLHGANPVFGGRFASYVPLGWEVPVGRLSVRLVAPEGRKVAARVHGLALAPTEMRRGGFVELRWDRAPAPAVIREERVPDGIDQTPSLQLSEWRDWGEVSSWAASLQPVPPPGAAMRAELARWRRLPSEEDRILAAVRFVQDEVRYLGLEVGANSHRPHAPGEVFERRFGDCKDKSLLLVTLLAALGIEAESALVATEDREALDARLPSPIEFDHAVVRVKRGGAWTWIDPTVTLERGPLASRERLPFRRALPVHAGAALVRMEDPSPRRVLVTSTLTIDDYDSPASLEVRTRWEGGAATRMRQRLAEEPLGDLSRSWLDFYARSFRDLRADGEPRVRDDLRSGAIEIVERYVLPPMRGRDDVDLSASEIVGQLETPRMVIRKQPLAIAHPVDIRETIRVSLPGPIPLAEGRSTIRSAASTLDKDVRVEGRTVVADISYVTVRDRVAPEGAPAFADAVREMRDAAGLQVPLGVGGLRVEVADGPSAAATATVLGGLVALGAVLFAGVWLFDGGAGRLRSAARRRAFARTFQQARGDSPATALALAGKNDLNHVIANTHCTCGTSLVLAGPIEPIRFNDSELAIIPLTCPRCGTARPIYASIAP